MANGYIQYVTSDAEYRAQHYEGGSTIYGPRSASVLAEQLGSLAGELGRSGGRSPANPVSDLVANPGDTVSVLPGRTSGPAPDRITRQVISLTCQGDTVTARWLDAWPGRLFPADTAIVRFESVGASGNPDTQAWDDDPRVEVRAIGRRNDGYLWQAQLSGARAWPRPIRFTGLSRPGFPSAVSAECR
jgi:neutral ceramidase